MNTSFLNLTLPVMPLDDLVELINVMVEILLHVAEVVDGLVEAVPQGNLQYDKV